MAEVAFVQTDPLPIVEMRVNGSEPAFFVVDTGGGELILDPGFADKVGARRFGKRTATFAGDATAEVELAHVERVALGTVTVYNVPVRLLPTGRFSAVAWGRPIAGVLGTTLLRQFRFTLDYAGGRLRLGRLGSDSTPESGEMVEPLRQMRRQNLIAVAHQERVFDDVAKLADVAGECVAAEYVQRVIGQGHRAPRRHAPQQALAQRGQIFTPLS